MKKTIQKKEKKCNCEEWRAVGIERPDLHCPVCLSQKEPEEYDMEGMRDIGKLKTKILTECTSWSVLHMNNMLWELIEMVKEYQRTQTIEEIKSLPTYTFQPVGGISNIEYIRKIDIE